MPRRSGDDVFAPIRSESAEAVEEQQIRPRHQSCRSRIHLARQGGRRARRSRTSRSTRQELRFAALFRAAAIDLFGQSATRIREHCACS